MHFLANSIGQVGKRRRTTKNELIDEIESHPLVEDKLRRKLEDKLRNFMMKMFKDSVF